MKRLLLLVTVSMLLAMWILSAWELAQAASSVPIATARASVSTVPTPVPMPASTTFRFVNLDGKHRISAPGLRRTTSQADIDRSRLDTDRPERQAAGTPILCDPIELRRMIR